VALVVKDRVKETTTTTGSTDAYNLAGAATGFQSFNAVLSNGDTTYYCCTDGDDFEVGIGTFASSGTTLARTTILESSNSNNAVNWGAGTRDVFITQPAEKAVFLDGSNNISIPGTIDGRDLATDGTKLDGIEASATADQTASEIRALVESASDSNVFTDADHTKLNGIEASATADQTAAEIRTLVESASDSNVFTDADHTKLNGIEASADVTDTANVTAAGALMDSEVTNLSQVKAFDSSDFATAAQGSTADSAMQDLVDDTSPQLGGNLDLNSNNITGTGGIPAANLTGTVANARLDAQLQDVAGLAVTNGNFIVGDGSNFVAESGSTARASLGLGTAAVLDTGISNTNVPKFTSGVADNDFLRVDGTAIEGRSASQVLSDIGGQASLTFGISNTNAVKIDSSSVADDEYARFTASGLESRSTSEVLSDIGGQAALTFGISNTNAVKIDSSSVADDEYARFTANGLESRSTSEVLSDIGGQASLTFGISNTNAVKIDSSSVADDEYARFTANGLESRSTSEVLSDIGAITASSTDTLTNKTINASQLSGTVANARLDAQLQDIAGLAVTNGGFIVGDGSNFVLETGATARTSLGLGTAAVAATGISNGNVPVFTSGVADDDFLRVNGTSIEGRSASEVVSDLGLGDLDFGLITGSAASSQDYGAIT
jgi:hypothetical protein